jgi:predicted Ser/Thr protein kinase
MTAPSKLGPYEIVRLLGRSMTDVYLAVDTAANRKAALKLIPHAEDSNSRLMIEAERRGAAIQKGLSGIDPRVVEIYDFGDLDGYFFVAMQYVEGRNLAEVLRSETIVDPNRAAVIALEICEQLVKFHNWESAVVHGDIKPSNIHLGPHDTVRLLDFGIAKTLRADCDATAHLFGSPGYCAPERLLNSQVDQQSDLWAVGATLYEMVAGQPPYRAEDTRRLERLIRSKRPPRALPPSCPHALRAIIGKALAPDPSRRYASAGEFQFDLQAFLEHRPVLAEIERRPWAANATIEVARACLRQATKTLLRARRALKAAQAVAWFGVGMALSVGGTLAWHSWHPRTATTLTAARPAPPVVPAPRIPDGELPELYASEAGRVIAAYRAGSDPALADFDWNKAEIYLARAVALGDTASATKGELALARGYATLERVAGDRYFGIARAQSVAAARADFTEAAQQMPRDADPHLALARLYVYSLHDLEKVLAEFAAAQRLGAALGPREIEQQADAWRMRAEGEAAARPQLARRDAQTAEARYQRIRGFHQVDAHLKELRRLHYGPVRKPAPGRRAWR